MKQKTIFISVCLLLITINLFSQSERRQLTVSLYPFIPNSDNFYRKVETLFEKQNPDIDLIINLNDNYYEDTGGVISEKADIYEIDCILLKDFIKEGKIQVLPKEKFEFRLNDAMPNTDIVYVDKKLYAIPHWLCGSFLFYNSTDSIINSVRSLTDLEKIIGVNPPLKGSLLIDLKGKQTLGGIYINMLFNRNKSINSLEKTLNKIVIGDIDNLLNMTYKNWGRIDKYHKKGGFYQKQFAKGNGRVVIGYSESLYDILNEINACHDEEGCIPHNKISINTFPILDNTSSIGWIDALAIDSKVKGKKLNDAIKFISFLTSDSIYHLALIPDYNDAPRYLLPAFKQYYTDNQILQKAPYYEQLYPFALKFISYSEEDILQKIKQIGKEIDTEYLSN